MYTFTILYLNLVTIFLKNNNNFNLCAILYLFNKVQNQVKNQKWIMIKIRNDFQNYYSNLLFIALKYILTHLNVNWLFVKNKNYINLNENLSVIHNANLFNSYINDNISFFRELKYSTIILFGRYISLRMLIRIVTHNLRRPVRKNPKYLLLILK